MKFKKTESVKSKVVPAFVKCGAAVLALEAKESPALKKLGYTFDGHGHATIELNPEQLFGCMCMIEKLKMEEGNDR